MTDNFWKHFAVHKIDAIPGLLELTFRFMVTIIGWFLRKIFRRKDVTTVS